MNRNPKRSPQPKAFDVHRTLATHRTPAQTTPRPHAVPTNSADQNDSIEPTKKKRFGWKRFILLLFIILLTPLLVIGVWDYRNFSSASQKVFGDASPINVAFPSQLASDSNGRTNLLLVGYSADNPNHGGANLTDSIMVVSLDKESKKGFTVSVPRDLYVDIPEYGSAKINEAYQAGEQDPSITSGSFGGGMGLLQTIVGENFGIELHYYVLVNYGAVRGTVDALDGINVTIESDDPRGIFDPNFRPEEGGPLQLANGPQRVDGQTALRLTRARGSTAGSYGFPLSDFNRTANQQKVFAGIKNELSWELILDPRTNSKVFDAVASNLKTNLELSELLPVFRLFQSVPDTALQPVNLREADGGVNLLTGYQTDSGQSALVPSAGVDDFSEIQALIDSLESL